MGKRIGIVTLVGNFNYGNKLQNYAVQRIYQSLGFEPVTLRYGGLSPVSWARHTAASVLLPPAENNPESVMGEERVRAFASFSSLITTTEVEDSLSTLADQFDYFSVGSDQVWNPHGIDSYRWMFLEFAHREQRVALAPSIGMSAVRSPYARHMMASGLRGFSRLSVRERDGARLIDELTGQSASVVIDPTLMLNAGEWRGVSRPQACPSEPYVLSYVLGRGSEALGEWVATLTDGGRARLVRLSDRSHSGEVDAGPAEFIALIDRARHVVTDSYHAAVISLIMGTPLTIFRRAGESSGGTFSRLETLAEKFNLWKCVFGDDRFEPSFVRDEGEFHRALDRERAILAEHLSQSLGGEDVSSLRSGVGME